MGFRNLVLSGLEDARRHLDALDKAARWKELHTSESEAWAEFLYHSTQLVECVAGTMAEVVDGYGPMTPRKGIDDD